MKVIRAGNPEYSLFHFEWILVNWCNYKCTYCSSAHFMTDQWQKDQSAANYKLTLARLKKFNSPFHIELYGGEPSLHPNINEIIDELAVIDNCELIEIITNLAKPLHFWQSIPASKVSICASYHPEFTDKLFIDKVRQLNDTHYIRTTVNLIDNPVHWPATLDFINQLTDLGIDYNLHYLNNTDSWQSNYSEEFFKTFNPLKNNVYQTQTVELYNYEFANGVRKLQDLEIYKDQLHHFKGYKCNPRFYTIGFDGTIKNMCTSKSVDKLLFNDQDISVTEICPNESCACEVMFNFYKEKV